MAHGFMTHAMPARTMLFNTSFKRFFFFFRLQPFPLPKGNRGTLN